MSTAYSSPDNDDDRRLSVFNLEILCVTDSVGTGVNCVNEYDSQLRQIGEWLPRRVNFKKLLIPSGGNSKEISFKKLYRDDRISFNLF